MAGVVKMKDEKYIKICGGLGNQMFQYAFAKALEKRCPDFDVYLDLYWFTLIRKPSEQTQQLTSDFTIRNYELDLFKNINPKFIPQDRVRAYFAENHDPKLSQQESHARKVIAEKNAFEYDEKLFENQPKRFFSGYFQNEEYFKGFKDELIRDFELPDFDKNDKHNLKLLKEIQSSNSVFIHIRRGDYIDLKQELSIKYYKRAVEYVLKTVKKPKFFVFGIDSDEFIKKELKIGHAFKFVGNKNTENGEDWKDFKLMQACKHSIIANSAFSWWAAWLSDYHGKIVTAPTPWIDDHDECICKNWVKISR